MDTLKNKYFSPHRLISFLPLQEKKILVSVIGFKQTSWKAKCHNNNPNFLL